MTGWPLGIETLYACPQFHPDPDQPDTCSHWIVEWACRLNDAGPCIWKGQPPAYQGPPEEDCHD